MQFAATTNNSSDTHKQKGRKKKSTIPTECLKRLGNYRIHVSLPDLGSCDFFFSFFLYPEPTVLVGISLNRRRPLQRSPEFHYILKVHSWGNSACKILWSTLIEKIRSGNCH